MSRRESDPAVPHSRHVLFRSIGVSVIDFQCRAHAEPWGAEEPNPTHSIVFIRRGVFGRTSRGRRLVADPNHVLFFNQAEPYRFSHPIDGGDDCTILALEAAVALEAVARRAPPDAADPAAPFRVDHGFCPARGARLHYELLALIRSRVAALTVEDTLLQLIDEALRAAYADRSAGRSSIRRSALADRQHRELVEATKLALNARLDAPPSLGELARRFGCSPFHVSRTFRAVTGSTLRSYATRLRARAAADCVRRGLSDLTTVALACGYADHSHLTNAFRREWGDTPSRFRARHAAAWRPRQR